MTFQPDVLGIPAGKLFWRFDGPVNPEHGQPHALGSTRPTLLFIHAAVSDHTLWDDQVAFCTSKGWGCLRYDLFGFGQSSLDQTLHTRDRISPVKLHEHTAKVVAAYLDSVSGSGRKDATRFVVIGLSRGGGIAVDFILSHPDKVTGLVICAGALGGLDVPNTSAEESAFNDLETLMNRHEIENATRTVSWLQCQSPPSAAESKFVRHDTTAFLRTFFRRMHMATLDLTPLV